MKRKNKKFQVLISFLGSNCHYSNEDNCFPLWEFRFLGAQFGFYLVSVFTVQMLKCNSIKLSESALDSQKSKVVSDT